MSDFNPDWASPPGDTIREMLNERRLSTMWLAKRIAQPFSRMVGLLAGKEPLDEELAADLTVAIGGSKEFWMTREAQYRQALAKMSGRDKAEHL